MSGVSFWDTNEYIYIWHQVNILAERQTFFLPAVKRHNLSQFGHVCRHDELLKIILLGTVDGESWPRKTA